MREFRPFDVYRYQDNGAGSATHPSRNATACAGIPMARWYAFARSALGPYTHAVWWMTMPVTSIGLRSTVLPFTTFDGDLGGEPLGVNGLVC